MHTSPSIRPSLFGFARFIIQLRQSTSNSIDHSSFYLNYFEFTKWRTNPPKLSHHFLLFSITTPLFVYRDRKYLPRNCLNSEGSTRPRLLGRPVFGGARGCAHPCEPVISLALARLPNCCASCLQLADVNYYKLARIPPYHQVRLTLVQTLRLLSHDRLCLRSASSACFYRL